MHRNEICMGVYEFVGVQSKLGGEIKYLHRLKEKEFLQSDESYFLVYRCSRCGVVETKMNDATNQVIKVEQKKEYEKEYVREYSRVVF